MNKILGYILLAIAATAIVAGVICSVGVFKSVLVFVGAFLLSACIILGIKLTI